MKSEMELSCRNLSAAGSSSIARDIFGNALTVAKDPDGLRVAQILDNLAAGRERGLGSIRACEDEEEEEAA